MVVNQCLKGLDKMNKRNISHTSEDDGSDSRKCSMICNSCDSQSGKHDVESDCHEEEIIILPNTINSTSNDLPVNTNSSQHLSQTEAGLSWLLLLLAINRNDLLE